MPNFRIDVELNADGTVAGVRSVENQLSKVDKAASNTSRIMEGLERRIKQVAVAFVTIKLVQQIKDAALLSQRYAELGLALGVVGRNTNVARAALDSQAVSLQKLGISMIESRQTLLRLAAANIDLKNATELADLARNAAIVGQINTSEALNRIVLGVTNASLVTLRSVGIVTTFDSAYKDLAEQLGVNITQLTDAEKQQARLNAVLAKAPALVGLYEESMLNAGKQLRSTDRLVENLQVKIGGLFDQTSLLAVSTYTSALKSLTEQTDELIRSGDLAEYGERVARAFAIAGDIMTGVFQVMATGTRFVQSALSAVGDVIKSLNSIQFSGSLSQIGEAFSKPVIDNAKSFLETTREGFASVGDLNRRLDDQVLARQNLAKATETAEKGAFGLSAISQFQNEATSRAIALEEKLANSYRDQGDTLNKVADARQSFIDGLRRELRDIGKTAAEIRRLDAAELGLADSQDELITKIELANAEMVKQQDAAKQLATDLATVQRITESVATAEEKFSAQLAELRRLNNAGLLDDVTFRRQVKNITDDLTGVEGKSRSVFKNMNQFAVRAARSVQRAFADFFFDPFKDGLDGIVKGFANAIRRLIAEAAALRLIQASGIGSILGFNSNGSGGGTNALNLAGAGLNVASIAGNIRNIGSNFIGGTSNLLGSSAVSVGRSLGINSLTSFGSGLTGSSSAGVFGPGGIGFLSGGAEAAIGVGSEFGAAATLGAGVSSLLGPAAVAFAGTQILKSLAGNKRVGGSFGNAINFVGDLPIIGDFLPSIPLINGIFGRGPLEQEETNLIGDFTSQGFEGVTSVKFKAEGGLARGDKVDRVITDVNSGALLNGFRELSESGISGKLTEFAEGMQDVSLQLGNFLNDSVQNLSKTAIDAAEKLNLSTESLANFSTGINIASEKGEFLTDQQLSKELGRVGDEIAKTLLPNLEEFQIRGESAFEALSRISTEFDTLEKALVSLGRTNNEAIAFLNNTTIEGRAAFVKAAGGIDAINQSFSSFSQNFLEAGEVLKPIQEAVSGVFVDLGLSANLTKDQFADLVKSFGKLNGISQEMLFALLNVQDAFLFVTNELQNRALDDANLAFQNLSNSVRSEIDSITDAYDTQLEILNENIDDVTASVDRLSSLSDALKSSLEDTRGLTNTEASNQILEVIRDAQRGIFPEAETISQALSTLSNLDPSGFSTRAQFELAKGANAGLISELDQLVGSQLSIEEQSLRSLENQVEVLTKGFDSEKERLDGILSSAETQNSILRGIDTSILELSVALREFASASARAESINPNIPLNSSGNVGFDSILNGPGNSSLSAREIRGFVNTPGRTQDEILNAALANNVSIDQFLSAVGPNADFTREGIEAFAASRGVSSRGGSSAFTARGETANGSSIVVGGSSGTSSRTSSTLSSSSSNEPDETSKVLSESARDSKATKELLQQVIQDGIAMNVRIVS